MGNQASSHSSESEKSHQISEKLIKFNLFDPFKSFTQPFIYSNFQMNLKNRKNQISRVNNPFCPFQINMGRLSGDDEWRTGCLISPLIAICNPTIICDTNSEYVCRVKLAGICKNNTHFYVNVIEVIIIEEFQICLLILEKPVVQLGWAGLKFLDKSDSINSSKFSIINHPKRFLSEGTSTYEYCQMTKTVSYKNSGNNFFGYAQEIIGSLIFETDGDRPYIVGIQINNSRARFIDRNIFCKIQEQVKKVYKQKKLKEKLKEMKLLHQNMNEVFE